MVKHLIFYIIFSCTLSAISQSNEIVLKGIVHSDSVSLKWSPSNNSVFESGLKYGYDLNIFTERNDGTMHSETIHFASPLNKIDSLEKNKIPLSVELNIIKSYIKKSRNNDLSNQLYGFLILKSSYDKLFAQNLGLYYKTKRNIKSTFSVSIPGTNFRSSELNYSNLKELQQSFELQEINLSNNKPEISWNAENIKSYYAAYNIERSTDNKNFKQINSSAILFLKSQYEHDKKYITFIDTTAKENTTYYYRTIGISPFFTKTNPTASKEIYIKPKYSPQFRIDTIFRKNNQIKIIPDLSKLTKQELEYTNFILLKYSNDPINSYKLLCTSAFNTSESNVLIDTSEKNKVYFKIELISRFNDTISSLPYYFFYFDSIPPKTPSNFEAHINESGIVTLKWNANNEDDLVGYKLYRSNSLAEDFIEPVNKIITSNFYTDTLNISNLDSIIYYKIASIDKNYNHSKTSEPLKLRKPDKISPVCASVTNLFQDKKSIILKWNNSTSSDLLKTSIYKIENGKKELLKENTSENSIIDTNLVPGYFYQYEISSFDKSKNYCSIKTSRLIFEPGYRDKIEIKNTIVNREKKEIQINYILPDEKIHSISIYRSVNNTKETLVKTISGNESYFIDKNLAINNIYTYRISYTTHTGIKSYISNPVIVEY